MGGYGLWQIEHRGEFRLALRRATSLPRGNKRDYVSYKTLVRWRFACALRGSARGFWFIDPLGLHPRGLCTVATPACHVNHAPPSYNYNVDYFSDESSSSTASGNAGGGESDSDSSYCPTSDSCESETVAKEGWAPLSYTLWCCNL